MKNVRSVRSTAQRYQRPSESDAATALGDELLLLLHQLLPLPHVLRHSQTRGPPLRRKTAIAQSPGEALRDGRRLLLLVEPPELDGGGLGQHVDDDRVNSVVGGQDVLDSGDARTAHHPGDIEKKRRVFALKKRWLFRRSDLSTEGIRYKEMWPEESGAVAVTVAVVAPPVCW